MPCREHCLEGVARNLVAGLAFAERALLVDGAIVRVYISCVLVFKWLPGAVSISLDRNKLFLGNPLLLLNGAVRRVKQHFLVKRLKLNSFSLLQVVV